MSLDRTRAVARRVLEQLRRDPRTLVLVFVMPPVLLWLLDEVFSNSPGTFARVGPLLLGLFPFTLMFVIASIALLRERTQGTLERLMASPLGRGDLLAGYALAFTLVALIQAVITMTVGLWLLDLPNEGALWLTFAFVAAQSILGVALGLFLSAFARSEFQAVQFLPAVVVPQILLAGLLIPIDLMPRGLELIARVLPLTYAFEGLDRIMRDGYGLRDSRAALDLAVIVAFALVFLILGSMTLRRSEA